MYFGGARRDRTDDLLRAKQALSQLSYGPKINKCQMYYLTLVGLGRLELPTSRLSGVRSNQLSYRPNIAHLPKYYKKEIRRQRSPHFIYMSNY
jgi:hypothetical protein